MVQKAMIHASPLAAVLLNAAHAFRTVHPKTPHRKIVQTEDKQLASRLSAAFHALGITTEPELDQHARNDLVAAFNAATILGQRCKSNGVQSILARKRTEETTVERILEYTRHDQKPKRASPNRGNETSSHDDALDKQVRYVRKLCALL